MSSSATCSVAVSCGFSVKCLPQLIFECLVPRWWRFGEDVEEVGPNWRKWVTDGKSNRLEPGLLPAGFPLPDSQAFPMKVEGTPEPGAQIIPSPKFLTGRRSQ